MNEIQKSIKATLYDRVTSPLIGSFIISWIIINWQLLYITIWENSSSLGKSKISYIEYYILNSTYHFYFKLWLIPAISTGLIIWLLPHLSELAFKLKEQSKARKLNIKLTEEEKVPLSINESIKLRNQIRDLQKEFEESNSEKSEKYSILKIKSNEQISLLSNNKETIESLEKQASNLYSDKKSSKEYSNKLETIVENNRKSITENFNNQKKTHQSTYSKFSEQERQKIEIIINDYNELSSTSELKQNDIEYLVFKNILIDVALNSGTKSYRLTEFGFYVSNLFLKQYF